MIYSLGVSIVHHHRIVHLQVLLTRCGHRIIDLGVSRTSSEVKDNTAIMLKIFALCIYLVMYVFI